VNLHMLLEMEARAGWQEVLFIVQNYAADGSKPLQN
jgi:hypothetical protein